MLRTLFAWLNPAIATKGIGWAHVHGFVLGAFLAGAIAGVSGTLGVQHLVASDGYLPGPLAPRISLGGATPPASWDLRRYVLRIHQQWASNSCVGQTLATITEIEARERGYRVPVSSGFIWNQINGGGNNPVTYQDAFALLQHEGDAPLATVGLDGSNYYGSYSPDAAALRAAYPYHANAGWHSVAVTDQRTIEAEIAAGHPLAYAAPWYWNWASHYNDSSALGYPTGGFEYWHSTVLVGFTPGGVILLNSFGTSWGSAGYAFLPWPVLFASAHDPQGGAVLAVSTIALAPKPKPKPFPIRAWNEWRTAYHKSVISPYDRHHHLTWPASIWRTHQSLRGIKSAGSWHPGNPGHMAYPFRRGTIYAWPKTHRYKVVRA